MMSLKTLLALKPQVLYPAHGPHIPSSSKVIEHLEGYISHRQQREDQILDLLRQMGKPGALIELMMGYFDRQKAREEAAIKDTNEFHTGAAYEPPAPSADGEEGDHKKAAPKVAPRIGYDMPAHPQTPPSRRVKFLEGYKPTTPGEGYHGHHDLFDSTLLPLSLLTRLVYDTHDEKLIFAAQRPVLAHLQKLEKDGKVRKASVDMRKIVDMKVAEASEVQEGWEIVTADAAETVDNGEEKGHSATEEDAKKPDDVVAAAGAAGQQ